MKLRQIEYCHNCRRDVIFEFDDVTDRQVIICPVCHHEHYRVLDGGTIINIRLHGINEGSRYISQMAELDEEAFLSNDPDVCSKPITVKVREIIGQTADGRPIVKPEAGEKTEKMVTKTRWGVDRSQRKIL